MEELAHASEEQHQGDVLHSDLTSLDCQRLFEDAPASLLVLRADAPRFTILTATEDYCRATLTHRRDILHRPVFEVFSDDPTDACATGTRNLRLSLERVLATRNRDTMALQKYAIRRPDGSFEVRYWAPVNSPLLDQQGKVAVIIHRVEDVTEYLRLRDEHALTMEGTRELQLRLQHLDVEVYARTQELLAAKRELEVRADELEQFAARVAHDIKSPLGALALRIHSIDRRKDLDSASRAMVDSMGGQVDRINALVDGLLEFARSGARPAPGARSRLVSIVGGVLMDLRPSADEFGLTLGSEAIPDVELGCAPGVLTSVLTNLVRNAVTASKSVAPARRSVTVRARQDGAVARVEVEDTGPGIRPELLSEVFKPYVRGPTSSSCGLGIGLATVKRLVEAHGGKVGVRSQPGQGSCFWFEMASV